MARQADLLGAALLALALGGVILAFATADPEVRCSPPPDRGCCSGSAVAGGRRSGCTTAGPPSRWCRAARCRARPAWGSLLVSFFVGAALIAALVDIPIFARVTVYPDSQLEAALVLVRFLVALPVGALVGGYLIRRLPGRAWSPPPAWCWRPAGSC